MYRLLHLFRMNCMLLNNSPRFMLYTCMDMCGRGVYILLCILCLMSRNHASNFAVFGGEVEEVAVGLHLVVVVVVVVGDPRLHQRITSRLQNVPLIRMMTMSVRVLLGWVGWERRGGEIR